MTSHAARTSLVQKCKKTGTRATCWVTPKIVWKRFADHPANSLRARLGTVIATSQPSRPLARQHGSKSKSLARDKPLAVKQGVVDSKPHIRKLHARPAGP